METVATQHAEYNLDAMRGSAYKASSLLKAMGNADRLMLLCQLSQGEHCVSDLEQKVGIGQPTLSQQRPGLFGWHSSVRQTRSNS